MVPEEDVSVRLENEPLDDDDQIYMRVEDPETTVEELLEIVRMPRLSMMIMDSLASSVNTPAIVLQALAEKICQANSPNEWLLQYLAKNPKSAAQTLSYIGDCSESFLVKTNLACNPRSPEDLLRSLMEENTALKRYVAGNEGISLEFMQELAMDPNQSKIIITALCRNINCPGFIPLMFWNDDDLRKRVLDLWEANQIPADRAEMFMRSGFTLRETVALIRRQED